MLSENYSSAVERIRRSGAALAAHLRFANLIKSLKANFDPNQPRDERGRWTSTGKICSTLA